MREKNWLLISATLGVLYVVYVIWAKFAKSFGIPLPINLGEVGEFWLFFSAIAAFVLQVITAELRIENAAPASPPEE
jgi:hypothetical protein